MSESQLFNSTTFEVKASEYERHQSGGLGDVQTHTDAESSNICIQLNCISRAARRTHMSRIYPPIYGVGYSADSPQENWQMQREHRPSELRDEREPCEVLWIVKVKLGNKAESPEENSN